VGSYLPSGAFRAAADCLLARRKPLSDLLIQGGDDPSSRGRC
jgi:hypothetical protein